jgi:hypothetical protein
LRFPFLERRTPMLRHSTNLPDALRIAAEREAKAELSMQRRTPQPATPKHVLRVRPSFVRLPRGAHAAS